MSFQKSTTVALSLFVAAAQTLSSTAAAEEKTAASTITFTTPSVSKEDGVCQFNTAPNAADPMTVYVMTKDEGSIHLIIPKVMKISKSTLSRDLPVKAGNILYAYLTRHVFMLDREHNGTLEIVDSPYNNPSNIKAMSHDAPQLSDSSKRLYDRCAAFLSIMGH